MPGVIGPGKPVPEALDLTQLAPEPESRHELELVPCPLCGADEGEPVAVGSDFGHDATRESFLALGCPRCELVYLSPRPAAEAEPVAATTNGSSRDALRRLVRRCRSAGPGARVLELAYGSALHSAEVRRAGMPTWVVETVTPHDSLVRSGRHHGLVVHQGRALSLEAVDAGYDLALLVHGLEHCGSPLEELRAVRRLLRPGGRVLVLTWNAESAVGRLFRGRHWAGYDFPRNPCLFNPHSLRRLADDAGLIVDRLVAVRAPEMWTQSTGNFLGDWGAPSWLSGSVRHGFFPFRLLASLVEGLAGLSGTAARLEAILRKPETAV
jgi:SAM-dependent methyltransferase